MKVVSPARRRESGSVLIGSLIIALVLGVTLISYLSLTSNQYRSIFRSQTWATSLALSEAGIEEALAMVNKYVDTGTDVALWPTAAPLDGWTVSGNLYSLTRSLNNLGTYTVYVTNVGTTPSIYAEGHAAWKVSAAPVNSFLATIGGVANSLETKGPEAISRRVEVRTRRSSVFAVAMVALGQIDLKGNNISTDSFDSSDDKYSTGGKYVQAKARDNGSVITTSTLVDSLNMGNAKIKGLAKTGPNGTIKIGPNGSVGSAAWVDSGKKGIEPGYSANDVNLQFPDATVPSGIGWFWGAPPGGTINGVTYDQIYTGGNYVVSTISGKKLFIHTNANVKIYISGNVSMTGSDSITIAPKNASLAIYMAGSTFKAAGNAALNNLSEKAENFAYYGLPNNKAIDFGGNANFIGTIYAPQADFSLGGGGNDEYDFIGASVTKTVTMNGKFNFHYDEQLSRTGPARGYVPTLWAER